MSKPCRPDDLRTRSGRSLEERRRLHEERCKCIHANPNLGDGTLAIKMQDAGLYSQRTAFVDMCRFVRNVREDLGLEP